MRQRFSGLREFVAHMHEARISWALDITGLTALFGGSGLVMLFISVVFPRGTAPSFWLLMAAGVLCAAALVESVVATFQSRFLPLPPRKPSRGDDDSAS